MEMTSSSDSKRLYISKKYENKVMMTQVIKTQGMRIPKVQTLLVKVYDNVGKLVFILCLSPILSQQTQNITYTVKVKTFATSN